MFYLKNKYKKRKKQIFYTNLKDKMSLLDIIDIVDTIGNTLVDLNEDEYGDFNIVSMEDGNEITIAISLVVYFV